MMSYHVRYDVPGISLTFNTAALVPRAVCWKNMRTVPSRRKNKNVPSRTVEKKESTVSSRRGRNYAPSRPVVKNYMHRLVPSSKYVYTVPFRRDNFYLPSRPVMKQKGLCTVPSRPVEKIHTHRPVPSHPGNYNFHYFTVPSSTFFPPNMSKQYRPVPSRILPAMKNLGKKYEK